MKRLLLLFIAGSTLNSSQVYSQDILAEIRDVAPEQIRSEGFLLHHDQEIEIDAVGFRPKRSSRIFTYAWILDAGSRKMVWDLEDASTDRRNTKLIEYRDKIHLPEGRYEIYFSTFPSHAYRRDAWGDFIEKIFDDIFDHRHEDQLREIRNDLNALEIVVRGRGERFSERRMHELRAPFNQSAFISWTEVRNDERLRQGFRLDRSMELHIYTIGEMRKEETFDYGWIVNTQTRDKVWKMTYRDSHHAGGAIKNRVFDGTIYLPEGQYVASFVTDDSHAYDHWNQPPPFDPSFWGLTIRTSDPRMVRYVETYEYEERSPQDVIVQITRLRDNEFQTQGFTLKRDLDLHIYSIGEGRNNEMFDYGWIVDTETRQKVWEMDFRSTEHAGGAHKNRMFDGVIPFRRGSYLVYYITDGSHSYWDWNSAAPHDRESWGITISAADPRFDSDDAAPYEPERDRSILVQLTRVRNHERERASFTLDEDGSVRVYAIGEGKDGRMYDYGWIERNDTRRVVWEMTYRMTKHAGGDIKNRLFDDLVFLRKGDYTVYFETDNSHSFGNWNCPPPADPVSWGITVYRKP